MAVKDENQQVKPEDLNDGKDDLAAFDALEKEEKEFNKVNRCAFESWRTLLRSYTGCRDRPHNESLQT